VIFIKALRETFYAICLGALVAKLRSASSDNTSPLRQVRLLRLSIPLSPAWLEAIFH
jgi:hypothetical protein